ncbi:metallophosphoesterase family protein [Leuconostoc suionicum]|uniref:metallophosphoesterase family protein n=1 Tax=Leuconostoc suionicum TaxID=1511761 RepID=UPI001B8B1AF4|nr:DNA repair exonuclease [Leuconostoc suionicum]MBS1007837.1 DNA repair exonuclease [Leuconostoc suionicum]
MKFIHAGDVHLGNPFSGLDKQLPFALKKTVQTATIKAFEQLIDDAISTEVDFVLFPGDLYNSAENSPFIQEVVSKQFQRLSDVNIDVFLSFGNHDFEADTRNHLPWPNNIHVFPQEVETKIKILHSGEKVALTGFSYQTQRQTEKIIDDFPSKGDADYQIGLYHGALGVAGDPYAPFSLSDMLQKNYDYWALGHIHIRQTLNEQPFIGYSGVLQGLNRKETGDKGYYLVHSENQRLIPEFKNIAPINWNSMTISSMTDEADLIDQIISLKNDKITFWSITITAQIDATIIERINSGVTLDKIRDQLPTNMWVVRLSVANAGQLSLVSDNIDQQYWTGALEKVFEESNITNYLPSQVPVFIREHFMSDDGQEELQNAMEQLIAERRQNNED